MLAIDMIPCEDAHAQERSLIGQVVARMAERDLWIADRNFCTIYLMTEVITRKAFAIIRRHGNFPIASSEQLRSRGRCSTGEVFEQSVTFVDHDQVSRKLRRIVVKLDKPTQDGDTEIEILTNVPAKDASA